MFFSISAVCDIQLSDMATNKLLIVDNEGDLCDILILFHTENKVSLQDVLTRAKTIINKACDDCDTLIYGGLIVNTNDKTVIVDGVKTDFTKTEFDLLAFLLKNRGKLFSRSELVKMVWPGNVVVVDRTVDVNMTRIRKKIGAYSANIVARAGFGYMFDDNNKA